METYLQFNPASTIRVEEQVSVVDNRAFLRHIPKKGSVVIDGFTEVDGAPQANQFYCDYATDSLYRDANRVLHFGSVNDYTFITVNYIAIGTVVTADDMNEIKAHLENDSLHGGSDNFFHKVANFVCFPYVTEDMASWSVAQYEHDFQDYAGRPSKNYDIVYWNDSGTVNGWAIRIDDKWINLGTDTFNAQWQLQSGWNLINPLLSLADRKKLAINPLFGFVPFSEKAGDIPLSPEGRKRFDDHKQYGEILVDLDHIEERKDAIDNDEDVNEDDYEGNYTLITRWMQNNDVDNIFSLGSEWGDICPLLTVKDRKLLDYLHDQLDDQID